MVGLINASCMINLTDPDQTDLSVGIYTICLGMSLRIYRANLVMCPHVASIKFMRYHKSSISIHIKQEGDLSFAQHYVSIRTSQPGVVIMGRG